MILRRRNLESECGEARDVSWDYTMGLPEDNGFSREIYNDAASVLTDDGVMLQASSYAYIKYTFPVKTAKRAVVEVVVQFKDISATQNGFRLLLSNGSYGNEIFAKISGGSPSILYATNSINGKMLKRDLDLNTDYKIRLEFDEALGNKVYVNDLLVGEYEEFSTYYCKSNALFQQDSGTTLLKSLKYKSN